MDANEHIYKKSIGRAVMESAGLNRNEAVGKFTGKKIGPTSEGKLLLAESA